MALTLPPPSPTSKPASAPTPTASGPSPSVPRRTLGYQPALDGLRAISVIAVLLYHGDVAWIPGGFLGVDVFFVISGFLITMLLIEEWQKRGTINRPQFWLRRARRLLPALFAVILATVAYTVIVLPDEVARLRGDVIAALTYTTNWFLIFSQQSYFEAGGRPSPLRHLWSLAVEEQFYILWPILFGLMLRRVKGKVDRLFLPLMIAALVSAFLMAWLFVPDADPSRVYYGTDTRAAGILLGAALACVWMPWRSRVAAAAKAGPLLEAVGVLAGLFLLWCFTRAGEFDPWLYRGGFFFVAVGTVVLIAVVVHPSVRLVSGALSTYPLTWVGLRSYGLYLWHWPVFVFMTAGEVGFGGLPLLASKFAVTFALAALSYQFVEMPIRRHGLAPVKRWLRVGTGRRRGLAAWLTAPVLAVAVPVGMLTVALASAHTTNPFGPGGEQPEDPAPAATTAPGATTAPAPSGAGAAGTTPAGPAASTPASAAGSPPSRIVVVGDSVGLTLVRNAPASAKSAFQITNGALEGCGVVEGAVKTAAKGFRWSFEGCKGWPEKWAANARKANAQVALVTIGAWDVFDLSQKSGDLTFGTPAFDTHFSSQLQQGIDALKGAGVKVALMEVPCFRPISAGGLRALPERGDDSRTRHLNDLLRQAAAADPANVVFIAGPQAYCTDEAVAKDVGQRWDGVHYYKPGAQLVWDTITPELQAIRV